MPIDVDALRAYLIEQCGTAFCTGFPAAFADLAAVEEMGARELCATAERFGVALEVFALEGEKN